MNMLLYEKREARNLLSLKAGSSVGFSFLFSSFLFPYFHFLSNDWLFFTNLALSADLPVSFF